MIKKQLLFALRRQGRHKLKRTINVLGLTFGKACPAVVIRVNTNLY